MSDRDFFKNMFNIFKEFKDKMENFDNLLENVLREINKYFKKYSIKIKKI